MTVDNDAIRDHARRILSEPDFQQYREQEEWFDFWKWLRDLFKFDMPNLPGTDPVVWKVLVLGLKGLLILLLILAVAFVAHWAYRYFAARQKADSGFVGITQQQRQEAHDMYAHMASEALAKQDYRAAMHFLFLAAMAHVIRDSLFQGSEAMTNREIAAASDFTRFPDGPQMSELFQEMVYFDEPRWFGRASSSDQDYRQFQQFYTRFIGSIKSMGLRGGHA